MGALDRWNSRRSLRAVTRAGAAACVQGAADIGGGGEITIGDRFLLQSRPARSHLFAAPGAAIRIGDDVRIGYGAAIAARMAVEIGSNSTFGPFLVVMDNDFHRVGDRNASGDMSPVHIGSNVQAGTRVIILRGSTIGDNVRILSGSMVSGVIPDGATVSGVPARVVGAGASAATARDIVGLVQGVLGLAERPDPADGPARIQSWDSLGTLRLLLAIEETYGISLDEDKMRGIDTVAALEDMVEARIGESMAQAAT